VFIVEIRTTTGNVCESYATFEEARRRVELFPAGALAGIPFIFEELPDGSQRLVRDDGKPLQWHRLPDDRLTGPDEPVALADDATVQDTFRGGRKIICAEPADDEPLPLVNLEGCDPGT
jgi:hypothetical protein